MSTSDGKAILGQLGPRLSEAPKVDLRRIEDPIARRLEEYHLHREDLEQAGGGLELLENLVNRAIALPDEHTNVRAANALYEGIVLAYCRCFDPTRRARLNIGQILIGKPRGLKAHELLWILRSKHYAHDVNDFRSARVGVIIINDKGEMKWDVLKNHPDQNVVFNTARLVRDALAFVRSEIDAMENDLRAKIAKMPLEELTSLPPHPVLVPNIDNAKAARPRGPRESG